MMSRTVALMLTGAALALFAIAAPGCGSPDTSDEPAATPASQPAGQQAAEQDHGQHEHGEAGQEASGQSAMEKMKQGLAGLSEADRQSAMKQHVCPVSGEMLGVMGAPIKVRVKDRDVWVCCEDCKEPLLADPDKYLAKLPGS